ncbi:MAG TPA: 6-bladed beta-propeller, partial [Gammaproteobacteria bacterium]|nr:6-bladed beta-propeller [Gammaproteobacteria bacterium]
MLRKILKIVGGFIISLVVLAIVGWIAFVPSPQGPGYQFAMAWGSKGSGPGQFRDPTGLAVAGKEVFVADARNGRIQVFDFNGKFLRQFGKPGKKPGEMKRPMNLRIVGNELYVAEYWNDRIQVFG